MITIFCEHCTHALRVNGDAVDVDSLLGQGSDYWPDRYPCYNCGKKAQGFLTPEISAMALSVMRVVDVNAQEAFAALNGLGVPSERTCCAEVIEELFDRHGIHVKGHQTSGQPRYLVEELSFTDGTRIQLGASPQGALIYRIVKPHSYVKALEQTNE